MAIKSLKNTNTSSIVPRDMAKLARISGNVYEALFIASKRAKQIGLQEKEELNSKLAEFASTVDNLEEVFENREQIEISKYYERQPKPSTLGLEELFDDKIFYRYPEQEDESLEDL